MLTISLALVLAISGQASAEDVPPGAAAHTRLKALVGEWEGPFAWSGKRSDAGTMHASYTLTGAGSAVVENLSIGGTTVMTSVYHMDGADLRMTHFCAAQNQPRLKADRIDLEKGSIEFRFVDVTNLKTKDSPHVRAVSIRLTDGSHMVLTFTFGGGTAEPSLERIELARVQKRPA